jgi:HEAT repeat protein
MRLVEGEAPPALRPDEQVVLAGALARYSRLVRGDARENIAAYFASSAAYEQALAWLRSRREWRRATAAFSLGDMAVPTAVGPLLGALDDRSRSVRAAAARSLGALASEEAIEPIVQQLASHRLPQLVAANALLATGPVAVQHLRELLWHTDARMRGTAVELLGLVGDARDAPNLAVAVLDPDAGVRERAARALGRVGARTSVDVLRAALRDTDAGVREAAATALGAIRDRDALPDLVALASSGTFEPARAAAYAVGAIDPQAAAQPGGGAHLREVSELLQL